MSKCPECKSSLVRGATRCACGWKEPTYHAFMIQSESITAERRREEEAARMSRWIAAGSPAAAESIARIKSINKLPKPSGRQHWMAVLNNPRAPQLSRDYAREALIRMGALPAEREPGADHEEDFEQETA